MSNGTPIDKIVEGAFDKVLRRTPARSYWTPAEVQREAMENGSLKQVLKSLGEHFGPTLPDGPWGIDKIVLRYIKGKIGDVMRVRDPVTGFRMYESHSVPGQHERRYMRLSGMTEAILRMAMEQTRTQEREYHLKGEGYHILLDELAKAGANATVDDVMGTALPRILAFRAKSA